MVENRRTREDLIEAVQGLLEGVLDDVPGAGPNLELGFISGGALPSERSVLNRYAISRIEREDIRRSYTLLDHALGALREQHPAQYRALSAVYLNEERSPSAEIRRVRDRMRQGDRDAKRFAVRLSGAIRYLAACLAPYDAHETLWSPPPEILRERKKRERSREDAYLLYRRSLKKHRDRSRAIEETSRATGYSRAQMYRIVKSFEEDV